MIDVLKLLIAFMLGLTKSRSRLEAENLALRQQLIVLRRRMGTRPRLKAWDRLIFVLLYRIWPSLLNSIFIVKPDTVLRWHRHGFRTYWRWKSRNPGGRPKIDVEIRNLIRQISLENPLWGAPRIHGELLKLGINIVLVVLEECLPCLTA